MSTELSSLLPRALLWVREQESRALRHGVALSEREILIARSAGVAHPERVRLWPVDSMPAPDDPLLQTAMEATGFWLHGASGLTLGHAILILAPGPPQVLGAEVEAWRDEGLIAHELVHVAQVERLGLDEFLRQYLEQCLGVGYLNAPLEREARAFRFPE